MLFNLSSTPFKCFNNHGSNSIAQLNTPSSLKRRCSPVAAAREPQTKKTEDVPINKDKHFNAESINTLNEAVALVATADNDDDVVDNIASSVVVTSILPQFDISPGKNKQYNAEKNLLLNSVMLNIEKAFERTSQLTATSQDDSGNYSRNENCDGSSTSYTSSSDLTNIETNNSMTKATDNQKSISSSSIELPDDAAPEVVCVRLCSLLKEQLIKCCNEIREKYYKEDEFDIDLIDANEILKGDGGVVVEMIDALATPSKDATKDNVSTLSANLIEDDNAMPVATAEDLAAEASFDVLNVDLECFQVLSNAPKTHKFHLTIFHPNNTQQYYKAVQREHRMLKNSLPPGVWVR